MNLVNFLKTLPRQYSFPRRSQRPRHRKRQDPRVAVSHVDVERWAIGREITPLENITFLLRRHRHLIVPSDVPDLFGNLPRVPSHE
jgi:hypothetical protein